MILYIILKKDILLIMHMKINIRFVTENYNSNITNFYRKEFKIIKNGIEYSYDQKTTIRDLFISLTTKFIRPYIKIGKCNPFKLFSNFSLFDNHRIKYNGEWVVMFNLDANLSKIIDLCQGKIIIALNPLIDKGATVLKENGVRFYMHSHEAGRHQQPHIHVNCGDGFEASINLLDGKILAGKLKASKKKYIMDVISRERNSFIINWNTITDGQKIEIKNEDLIKIAGV